MIGFAAAPGPGKSEASLQLKPQVRLFSRFIFSAWTTERKMLGWDGLQGSLTARNERESGMTIRD
jgi:hypothetical protein